MLAISVLTSSLIHKAAVRDKGHLQGQVIKELVCAGDLSLAAYFARKYNFKYNSLPAPLQHFMKARPHESNGLRVSMCLNTPDRLVCLKGPSTLVH